MEYIKAMETKQRVHDKYFNRCTACPLHAMNNGIKCGCDSLIFKYPEKAEEILKKWDKENPVKTFLSDFLEKYPKAPLSESGAPTNICPHYLGYCKDSCDDFNDCLKCWNRPLESEVK